MMSEPLSIPTDLPTDPAAFFAMTEPFEGPLIINLDSTSPLLRLGPSPFPKAGFPLLGFLETVYDHIAEHGSAQPTR